MATIFIKPRDVTGELGIRLKIIPKKKLNKIIDDVIKEQKEKKVDQHTEK